MADEIRNENEVEELDWDSGIDADAGSEFTMPPAGEYGFTVTEFEKMFSRSGKRMARLTLELDAAGNHCRVNDYIVLTQAWKLAKFFESLGFKKKGVPLAKMPWNQVVGACGKVKIMYEPYNGKEYVKVDKYIPLEDTKKTETTVQEDNLPFDLPF